MNTPRTKASGVLTFAPPPGLSDRCRIIGVIACDTILVELMGQDHQFILELAGLAAPALPMSWPRGAEEPRLSLAAARLRRQTERMVAASQCRPGHRHRLFLPRGTDARWWTTLAAGSRHSGYLWLSGDDVTIQQRLIDEHGMAADPIVEASPVVEFASTPPGDDRQ